MKDRVSSPDLEGRGSADYPVSCQGLANSSGSVMVMRPVNIDRKALSSSEVHSRGRHRKRTRWFGTRVQGRDR